jgi:hypothetical protein
MEILRMRTRNYVLATAVPTLIAAGMLAYVSAEPGASELLPFALAVGLLPGLAVCTLLYKAWRAVRHQETRPSPAAAVAGLLVPVFNLYWVWRVWTRWPAAYNAAADRAEGPLSLVPDTPFRIFVVSNYLALALAPIGIFLLQGPNKVQGFGLVLTGTSAIAGLISMGTFIAILTTVCGAVNRLRTAAASV